MFSRCPRESVRGGRFSFLAYLLQRNSSRWSFSWRLRYWWPRTWRCDRCDRRGWSIFGVIYESHGSLKPLYAVDIYSEGVVHTDDLTGESYTYSIKRARAVAEAHAAAAASAVLTVNLQAGDTVKEGR